MECSFQEVFPFSDCAYDDMKGYYMQGHPPSLGDEQDKVYEDLEYAKMICAVTEGNVSL